MTFSYIKIPEKWKYKVASKETEVAKQVVNVEYIGVAPKAPAEYYCDARFPNEFETAMFQLEDERYTMDCNILKYKSIIKFLEETSAMTDEEQRAKILAFITKSHVSFALKDII